jgi:hypothetical protein
LRRVSVVEYEDDSERKGGSWKKRRGVGWNETPKSALRKMLSELSQVSTMMIL